MSIVLIVERSQIEIHLLCNNTLYFIFETIEAIGTYWQSQTKVACLSSFVRRYCLMKIDKQYWTVKGHLTDGKKGDILSEDKKPRTGRRPHEKAYHLLEPRATGRFGEGYWQRRRFSENDSACAYSSENGSRGVGTQME